MSAGPLTIQPPSRETMMVTARKNDSELYLWAMGWILARLRNDESDLTLDDFGAVLGMTGPGYKNFEKGESPNFHRWCAAFDHLDKDIVAIMALARIIVRNIQAEEMFSSERLSLEGRRGIAEDAYAGMPKQDSAP